MTSRRLAVDKAQQFLWHLRPEWRTRFDHDHWWPQDPKGEYAVSFLAAAWEVVRRHPKVEAFHAPDSRLESLLAAFIATHGLGSWPKLAKRYVDQNGPKRWNELEDRERQRWEDYIAREWRDALAELPPLRGFDPRPVVSVTLQSADVKSGAHPQAALTRDEQLRTKAARNPEVRRALELAEKVREEEIARLAVEHHRAGGVLIAIHPDTANLDEAVEVLRKCYGAHRRPIDRGKGRVADWLSVIRQFESAELDREKNVKRNADLFTRYRRVVDGFSDWF